MAQESQASCSAEEWNSTYVSSCSRMTPLFVLCVEPAYFSEMHGGVSAPSCCAFIHRFAFEEVSGHQVLLKCGPGNWGLSACCTTHEAKSRISSRDRPHPEVHRKGQEPFPDKAGESAFLSDQEERRGSDEVMQGTSVFPLSETGKSGKFSGCIKGAKYRFALQDGTWDFS